MAAPLAPMVEQQLCRFFRPRRFFRPGRFCRRLRRENRASVPSHGALQDTLRLHAERSLARRPIEGKEMARPASRLQTNTFAVNEALGAKHPWSVASKSGSAILPRRAWQALQDYPHTIEDATVLHSNGQVSDLGIARRSRRIVAAKSRPGIRQPSTVIRWSFPLSFPSARSRIYRDTVVGRRAAALSSP